MRPHPGPLPPPPPPQVKLDQDFVVEELEVNGRKYTYKQIEGSFTQPNGVVCQHMLSWAQVRQCMCSAVCVFMRGGVQACGRAGVAAATCSLVGLMNCCCLCCCDQG